MPDTAETTYQLSRGVTLAVALALGLMLERLRPHARLRPAWRANLGLWAVDGITMALICGACGWVVAAWASRRGWGLLPFAGAQTWFASLAGVAALDAVSYFWHRANHQIALLWRFHRVHHADSSFHVTTALRFHPGELILALPVRLAAIVVLGVPPEGVLLFEISFGVANLLVHGNFDLPRRFEPFVRRILVTPTLHRAHHAADWNLLDTNFGTVFSIWDCLGRTFCASDSGRVVTTGLPGRSQSEAPTLAESLLMPFSGDRSGLGR